MATYTIYHNATQPADILKRADDAIFVKEGFSKSALFGQWFWLLTHRLWIASALYIASLIFVLVLGGLLAGGAGAVILIVGFIIGFGFEANDIRAYFLNLRGSKLIGVVEGPSLGVCEEKFFKNMATSPKTPISPASQQLQKSPIPISSSLVTEEETAIGLFPKPGV